MQTVWEEERMPAEWREGELVSIHKKGQHLICENYRGLCMLSVGYKIFSSIFQRRLAPYYSAEVGDYQTGFKWGQSTVDQLFIMRQLLEKNYDYDRDSWHVFIDFKQAYDSVSRESLWVIMRELNIPAKLIRLCRACYLTVGFASEWVESALTPLLLRVG